MMQASTPGLWNILSSRASQSYRLILPLSNCPPIIMEVKHECKKKRWVACLPKGPLFTLLWLLKTENNPWNLQSLRTFVNSVNFNISCNLSQSGYIRIHPLPLDHQKSLHPPISPKHHCISNDFVSQLRRHLRAARKKLKVEDFVSKIIGSTVPVQ